MNRAKVVVAMSGGVDSSVTAAILKEAGYEVIGITMHLWSQQEEPGHRRPCCVTQDVNDARYVCHLLGIPHYVVSYENEFRTCVIDYFTDEYSRGRTPNPCIACNHKIKFEYLLERAVSLGAQFLATGHYARIEEKSGRYHLLEAMDRSKDQSYVLYMLAQQELGKLMFPLGEISKKEVRSIALRLGLPVSEKADSQEICFIPDGNCRAFLSSRLSQIEGEILDISGNLLGRHKGIAGYTIGQRQGLGLASRQRLYIVGIDVDNNRIFVGGPEDLLARTLWARQVNWVSGEAITVPKTILAKIRYRSPKTEATLLPAQEGVIAVFSEPQRAITPGQAVVFYENGEIIGGGIIDRASRDIPPEFT